MVEEKIRAKPPDERRAVRQAQSKPLLDALRQWLETSLSKLSRKSDTTAAIRYALSRWNALGRYIEDGHIGQLIFSQPLAFAVAAVQTAWLLCRGSSPEQSARPGTR